MPLNDRELESVGDRGANGSRADRRGGVDALAPAAHAAGPASRWPAGGVAATPRLLRRWGWRRHAGGLVSRPLRCRRVQWYFVRARSRGDRAAADGTLTLLASGDAGLLVEQRVRLSAPGHEDGAELLGWFATPDGATHLELRLDDDLAGRLELLTLHPVDDCRAVCHPSANVPRWTTYGPGAPVRRVCLPTGLRRVAAALTDVEVELVDRPESAAALASRAADGAVVVDPLWIDRLNLSWKALMRLARRAWVVIDLGTAAVLLRNARLADARVRLRKSPCEVGCARADYAGVATRGLALHDVIPYGVRTAGGAFAWRGLRATPAWRRFAGAAGCVTLLSDASVEDRGRADVFSAFVACEAGGLVISDAPWLAAGCFGPPLAPRLMGHLMRSQLALAVDDWAQYWVRSAEPQVQLREIAEMQRHYRCLHPVRWAEDGGVQRLGLALSPATLNGTGRHLVLQTGRIDPATGAAGVAPEAMMILMKHLAREARDATAWAARHLRGLTVTWQFDSPDERGFRHAYASASTLGATGAARTTALVDASARRAPPGLLPRARRVVLDAPNGVLGDGSLAYQRELARAVRVEIERLR